MHFLHKVINLPQDGPGSQSQNQVMPTENVCKFSNSYLFIFDIEILETVCNLLKMVHSRSSVRSS